MLKSSNVLESNGVGEPEATGEVVVELGGEDKIEGLPEEAGRLLGSVDTAEETGMLGSVAEGVILLGCCWQRTEPKARASKTNLNAIEIMWWRSEPA